MDCAKAILCFSRQKVRFAAIPTTSGSGSEVTDFAILTHAQVKHPLIDPSLQPDAAILDGTLLEQLPGSLIADGGFDVITHAVEAYTAKGAGSFSDLFALGAFRLAWEHLSRSYEGSIDSRLPMHEAATMAGVAFNQAGLGLCHALSHSLGARFHVPHGRLNAILLPGVLEQNLPGALPRYGALARAAGIGGASDTLGARNLLRGLRSLRSRLHLPETLAQAGVDLGLLEKQAGEIAQAALEDPCCRSNPVPVTAPEIRTILRKVSGGE